MKPIISFALVLALLPLVTFADDNTPAVELPQSPTVVEAKKQYDAVASKAKADYLAKVSVALKAFQQKLDQAEKAAEHAHDVAEVQRIVDLNKRLDADPELAAQAMEKAEASVDTSKVVMKVMLTAAFLEENSKRFPLSGDLARGGMVKASSTCTDAAFEDPAATLGGVRSRGDIWCMQGGKGTYQATWAKPLLGRYIIIVGRPTPATNDLWGDAHLQINNSTPLAVQGMCGSHTLVIDLGKSVEISSIKIDFDGIPHVGLCDLEIHPDKGASN